MKRKANGAAEDATAAKRRKRQERLRLWKLKQAKQKQKTISASNSSSGSGSSLSAGKSVQGGGRLPPSLPPPNHAEKRPTGGLLGTTQPPQGSASSATATSTAAASGPTSSYASAPAAPEKASTSFRIKLGGNKKKKKKRGAKKSLKKKGLAMFTPAEPENEGKGIHDAIMGLQEEKEKEKRQRRAQRKQFRMERERERALEKEKGRTRKRGTSENSSHDDAKNEGASAAPPSGLASTKTSKGATLMLSAYSESKQESNKGSAKRTQPSSSSSHTVSASSSSSSTSPSTKNTKLPSPAHLHRSPTMSSTASVGTSSVAGDDFVPPLPSDSEYEEEDPLDAFMRGLDGQRAPFRNEQARRDGRMAIARRKGAKDGDNADDGTDGEGPQVVGSISLEDILRHNAEMEMMDEDGHGGDVGNGEAEGVENGLANAVIAGATSKLSPEEVRFSSPTLSLFSLVPFLSRAVCHYGELHFVLFALTPSSHSIIGAPTVHQSNEGIGSRRGQVKSDRRGPKRR